jgi:hypothetical protein
VSGHTCARSWPGEAPEDECDACIARTVGVALWCIALAFCVLIGSLVMVAVTP